MITPAVHDTATSVRRWIPVFAMMLVSMISYVDRTTLAILAPTIVHETHLNNEQYGFIVLAFSFAYTLGNPVWGVILDRIGTRRGMISSVSLWSLASLSHAFAGSFSAFAVARGILGFGEGATFPGAMRTSMETLPPTQRSRGIALSFSGGALGAMFTPLIVTPIALNFGWRAAFWFTGGIGAFWLLLWALISREPASQEVHSVEKVSLHWNDSKIWAFIAAYALGALPIGFVLNDTSLYLNQYLHKTQAQIGAVLWIPPLGWEAGYFFWGWFTDRFLKSGGDLLAMRRAFFGLALVSSSIAVLPHVQSFALTMLLLAFVMFLSGGFIIGSLAYANHQYPKKYSGLIAGIGAGSWSAMVGLVMPGLGHLFDLRMYEAAFLVTGLCPPLGFLCWWWLDGRGLGMRQAD